MAKKQEARIDLQGLDIEAIIAQLNKKYGDNTVALAEDAEGASVRFISSGVYALDFALGGGFPENRISGIVGPYSSLKSTISLTTARNFQEMYSDGVVVYVDAEKSFDPNYSKNLGLNNKRVLIINADSGEQGVDVFTDMMDTGRPALVIVDSLAALVPSSELEGSMDNQFMGLHARLINRMMRVATARTKRNLYSSESPSTTILALNQLREKIGIVYGDPTTTPGGRGKEFAFSALVKFNSSPSRALTQEVTRNGQKRKLRYGQSVDFTVTKNKTSGSQFEEDTFTYYVRPHDNHKAFTFDNEIALFKFGVFYGAITQEGRDYLVSAGGRDFSAKTQDLVQGHFVRNPDVAAEVYQSVLASIVSEHQAALEPEIMEEFEEVEETPAPKKAVVIKKKK